MSRVTIGRGAGLIYNGQTPLKTITYDETDKDILTSYLITPISQVMWGTFSASGMYTVWTESNHQAPASYVLANGYTNFSFTAYSSNHSTTYQVYCSQPSRNVEVRYIIDWNGGNPIYQTDTVSVQDFQVSWNQTVWTIATGGVRIFDNPDRSQRYVAYDWDDNTYGRPDRKVGFTARSANKYNNVWYTSIHPNIVDVNNGTPYYVGSNNYEFICTYDNPGYLYYNITTTNLTATNQTS